MDPGNGQPGLEIHSEGAVAGVVEALGGVTGRAGRAGTGTGASCNEDGSSGGGSSSSGTGGLFGVITSRLISLQSIVDTAVQMKEGSESELMQQVGDFYTKSNAEGKYHQNQLSEWTKPACKPM